MELCLTKNPKMIYPLLTIEEIHDKYTGHIVRVFISNSNGRWAVQDYDTEQTMFNADYLPLIDVTTYVDQIKRSQCVKHVRLTHAYVVGTIGPIEEREYKHIDYDPHSRDCFFWADTGEKFVHADYAYCGECHVFASR